MVASIEKIAVACAQIMIREGYSLEEVEQETIPKFWPRVKQQSGDGRSSNAFGMYAKRHKADLLPLIKAELERLKGEAEPVMIEYLNQSEPIRQEEPVEAIAAEESEIQEPEPPVRQVSERSETWVTRQDFDNAIATLTAMVKEIQDNMSAATASYQKRSESHQIDNAPLPPMDGKKLAVPRAKIGITLDSVLRDLVETESKKRRLTLSQMFDTVVWEFFGRPKLSFQSEDVTTDDSAPDES